MGSGLVYLVVILLWAVVLVPQWMRRHERNSEQRSTLTFHRAMKTLERRRAGRGVSRARHDVDVTVAGARTRVHDRVAPMDIDGVSAIDRHLDEGVDPFVGSVAEEQVRVVRRVRASARAQKEAEKRRRHITQALIAVSVLSVLLAFVGVLPVALSVLCLLALGGYLFAARNATARSTAATSRTVRRENARLAHLDAESTPVRRKRDVTQMKSSRHSRRQAQRHLEAVPASGHSVDTAGDDVELLTNDEIRTRRAAAADGWEPVESPLPTYVDAAPASRIRRNLDSTENGDWNSERMLEQAEALRTFDADVEAELGLDVVVEVPEERRASYDDEIQYRRAVND